MTAFSPFPLQLPFFSVSSFTGDMHKKKRPGRPGLNKGREGVENKSKTEEIAGGKKGMLA